VRWRTQSYPAALEAFVKALRHPPRRLSAGHRQTFRQAAPSDLVQVYAQVGSPDRACAFLHRVVAAPANRTATLDALTHLGDLSLELGRRAQAITDPGWRIAGAIRPFDRISRR